jgi:hypothetical protein
MSADVEVTRLWWCEGWQTRPVDGYVNATALCAHHGKDWATWITSDGTAESPYSYPATDLVEVIARSQEVPVRALIREVGGVVWVHPEVGHAVAAFACTKYRVTSVIVASTMARRGAVRAEWVPCGAPGPLVTPAAHGGGR